MCVCLRAHECKRVYMCTLLFIYIFIYLFTKMTDFAKAGGKEEGGSHYPIQVFFVSIYCVRKCVRGTNMCTSTQPHGAVYTVG